MRMEIIDNFLPSYHFKQLQSIMMGYDFNWFWNDQICYEGDPFYQFYHSFYQEDRLSKFYENVLDSFVARIKHKKMHRIKANLNPRTIFHRNTGYHSDYPNMTTSIFYVNTNNGWTQFEKGGKVKCVENRLVTFDSNQRHAGVTCTHPKRKVVINFNYER
jgi:hypothetical protein